MSVFITSITELSRNFFHLDPFKYDEYFAITPFFQKHCPNASLLHRVCLIPVKVIHDGPIHAPAAVVKTIMAIVKSIFAILLEVFGIEIDYRTPFKQGLAHLVLGVIHLIEAPLSLIPNTHKIHLLYLDRISKIKNSLAKFLETSNKNIITKNIIVSNPETEKALKRTQKEVEEKELALQEEQRKAKEQDELLQRAQQELSNIRNSDFIFEEELEKISKEAQQVLDTEVYEEDRIEEESTDEEGSLSSPNDKLPSSYYTLAYDDTKDWSFDENDGECEEAISSSQEQFLKREKRSIENSPSENKSVISEREEINPQKNIPVTRNSREKAFSHNNPLQSARARRLEYDKTRRNRRKKKSQSVNS
jgi:hypothetical protein